MRVWTAPSVVGDLLVAAGSRGVLRVAWDGGDHLRRRLSAVATVVDEPDSAVDAALRRYASGDAAALAAVRVDLRFAESGFVTAVLDALHRLEPGRLVGYGELARLVGRPGAAQAVGRAVAANPVPVVVPCHRVVAADGSLGGFSGGLARKRTLLAHEGFADLPGGWTGSGEVAGQLALEL